jgi:cysteinyl-tRNA synthetase
MALRVFNTMTNKKEDFAPLKPGKVGMYVCGVTTYDLCHVGHARVYVVFDTVLRWLERDHHVTYVRNFTDVDDKIIKRANESGEDPIALAARYAEEFHVDMDALGVKRAHVEPRVSTHMSEIISFVQDLLAKGYAYRIKAASGDDVYFRVKKMDPARYLQLSHKNAEDLQAGARIAVDERKEDPADFALWKSAKPGEVFWESPFGKGRPGWHIECSAMSLKHLGVTFDIHAGGKDLVFPHHTNEIAQSECRHDGAPMARYWLHNGFINFDGEKMSKSLGNFFTIRDVLQFATGEALRFQLLSTHYRSEVGFDVITTCPKCGVEMNADAQKSGTCGACGATSTRDEIRARVRFPLLEEAEKRVQAIYETRRRVERYLEKNPSEDGPSLAHVFKGDAPFEPMKAFVAAMEDDFNTAEAVAAMWGLLTVQNLLVDGKEKERTGQKLKPAQRACLLREAKNLIEQMGAVLGVGERDPAQFLETQRALRMKAKGVSSEAVSALLAQRAEAKAKKDYAAADAARAALVKLGVEVRDTPDGVEWTL